MHRSSVDPSPGGARSLALLPGFNPSDSFPLALFGDPLTLLHVSDHRSQPRLIPLPLGGACFESFI